MSHFVLTINTLHTHHVTLHMLTHVTLNKLTVSHSVLTMSHFNLPCHTSYSPWTHSILTMSHFINLPCHTPYSPCHSILTMSHFICSPMSHFIILPCHTPYSPCHTCSFILSPMSHFIILPCHTPYSPCHTCSGGFALAAAAAGAKEVVGG